MGSPKVTTKELPEFVPSLGVISVAKIRENFRNIVVCSQNQEGYYREMGYTQESVSEFFSEKPED